MATFEELSKRYTLLLNQYQAGNFTSAQFLAEVQQLRTQDSTGTWWAINSEDGSFLRYDGSQWVPAKTPAAPAIKSKGKSSFKIPQLPDNLRPLLPIAGLVLSTSCGVIWTLYSFLRVGQGEQADCMTVFILGGIPITLWIFRKQLGVLLRPLEPIRSTFPRPVLLGIAFAVPVVLGVLFSSVTSYGYGAMRLSAIISILSAFVLTRRPEVQA